MHADTYLRSGAAVAPLPAHARQSVCLLQASSCSLFSLSIMNSQGQLTLSEICQQRIALVDQKGAVVFNQPPNSCMWVSRQQGSDNMTLSAAVSD